MQVEILGPEADAKFVAVGPLRHLGMLREDKLLGVNKICDSILVVESDKAIRPVLIELKETMDSGKANAVFQLRRSRPVFEYMRSVAEVQNGGIFGKDILPLKYTVIAEKQSNRIDIRVSKPQVTALTEVHGEIAVAMFVGNVIALRALVDM